MPSRSVRLPYSLGALLCLSLAISHGDGRPSVTTANWDLASRWSPVAISDLTFSLEVNPHWIGTSDRFWYRFENADGIRHWLVDPAVPSKRPLFDHGKLASILTQTTGADHDKTRLDLEDLQVEADGTIVRFTDGEHRYEYWPQGDLLTPIGAKPAVPEWCAVSPNGHACVFARGHDLVMLPLGGETDEEVMLTGDGVRGWGWGSPWDVIEDGNDEPRKVPVAWAPDSRRFAIQRADARRVAEYWNVNHLAAPRPTLKTFKYPMPGEVVPEWQVWVVDVDTKGAIQVDTARWPDQTMEEFFVSPLWWSDDSRTVYFVRRSRDYRMLDLCSADSLTGKSRVLVEERLDGMVYARPQFQLPDGRFLWWSIREGWGHFGLYDAKGSLVRPLTNGPFNVDDIAAVDATRETVFLMANGREEGRNPYYQHLYRVGLDGSGLRLLTPEDADHRVDMSPTSSFFVDRIARVDLPTRSVVRDADGHLVMDLEVADVSQLKSAGWQPPERFKALSADGETDQWGVMWKPFDFNPRMSYPIVTRVYPGRMDEYIPKRFSPINTETGLAQLGCIVVQFGNRGGSRFRGLAYREYGREQFRDYGLADKKAVIEDLADRFEFIDAARVGIYGASSGGFMVVSAMLVYPDFFQVGVAMNGPHDPSIQSVEWVERYAGVNQVTANDGSSRWEPAAVESNLEIADRLKGRLLLIHGTQDEIVPLSQHMRMIDAFVQSNKRVDQFIIPGAGHGLPWRYTYGLVWTYFAEHLIGEPRQGLEIYP